MPYAFGRPMSEGIPCSLPTREGSRLRLLLTRRTSEGDSEEKSSFWDDSSEPTRIHRREGVTRANWETHTLNRPQCTDARGVRA